MRWPWQRPKPYVAPWWNGYVQFPEGIDTLSIVLSRDPCDIIVVLHSTAKFIEVFENRGTYLNKKIVELNVGFI